MAPVDPDAKIPCGTPQELDRELDYLSSILCLGEKEDTWEKMEKALIRFAGVTRGGGYKHLQVYVEGVGRKGCGLPIVACMMSDRGRLSGVATELLQTLAPRLGANFAPLVTLYVEPLVTLLGRPNKVFLKRAEKCLATIISHCQLLPILPLLRKGLNDEAATCRRGCATGIQRIINEWDKDVLGERGVVVLEDAVRKLATDKDAEVRKIGKSVWASYMEIWPERVEESVTPHTPVPLLISSFSAPLTPTIRRYLDIPANGMPAKPKARPPPIVPKAAAAAPLANSLTSSTKTASSPPRAANPRVQALGGKPARVPPAAAVPAAFELEKPVAGPSRRQVSPRTAMDLLPRPPPPAHSDSEPVRLAKSSSSANLRADAAIPFKIGLHGRSVSHAVLPSAPSSSSLSSLPETANPLSKPVRPMLPPSFSSLSLPPDPFEALIGAKRVPSTRRLPVKPPPEAVEEETNQIFATPAPLRGAARVENPMMQARKMMGQAQRVVLPPPSENRPMLGGPTPAPRTVSRSVRDRIQELEKASTPTKVEPAGVPLPLSPVDSKHVPSPRMLSAGSPVDKRLGLPPASPMMPVLSQSVREGQEGADVSATELLKMEVGGDLMDRTVVPVDTTADNGAVALVEAYGHDITSGEESPTHPPVANAMAVPQDSVASANAPSLIVPERANTEPPKPAAETDDRIQSIAPENPQANVEITSVGVEMAAANVNEGQPISSETTTKPPSILASSVSSRANSVASAKPAAKATLKPDVKLPSVAAKPSGRRVVTAPERRPFKPTSQTAMPKQSSLTAPTAATAARAAATKASTKPEDVVRAAPKVPEVPRAAPCAPTAAVPKAPTARVVSGGSFAAPTKASASRTTGPAPTAAAAAPSRTATKITLPPVKKEKVRLKAPLPKFMPVRGGLRATSESSAKLAESTSSVSTANSERKPGIIRAKVKPEMVALPTSPVETKTAVVDSVTSPAAYTFKEGVVARIKKVKPEAVPLPPSPASVAAPLVAATIPLPDSPVSSNVPLAEHVPLPPSPLATTSALPLVSDEPGSASSAPARLSAPGLPLPLTSTAAQTPISKASTAATAPYHLSDSSDESDDDEEGVTFRQSGGVLNRAAPKPKPAQVVVQGDLMEFSAPSRASKPTGGENDGESAREAGKLGSTTPKSSPSRPLRLRDANTPRSKGEREEVF